MDKEEYKQFYSEVYRHSLAHILAKAVVELFGKEHVQYAIGPQISDGFYYDFLLPRNLTNDDFKTIEDKMREIIKRREDWKVDELSKDEALSLFSDQKFKVELINDMPEDDFDSPLGQSSGAGVIFGVTGGVTEAVIRYVLADSSPDTLQTIAECGVRGLQGIKAFEVAAGDLKLRIAVANGLGNADKLIEKVETGEEYFDFIEVMACPNGCIGGGGQPPASNRRKAEREKAIFTEDAACVYKIPQENPDLKYVYDELMQGRAHELLHIHYPLHHVAE